MKKKLIFAAITTLFLSSAIVFGANETFADTTVNISASDLQKNARRAINNALTNAKDKATSGNKYIIKIPSGEYSLDACLYIYGNTTLDLEGVTLKRGANAAGKDASGLIHIGDSSDNSAETGATGYFYENIAIKGGVIDGNAKSATILKAAHVKNFSMTGTTLQNNLSGHLMEVAGVNGLTITNCTFKDQVLQKSDSEARYEAIQFDVIYKKHFSTYRSEALSVNNVRISGCQFINVPRGIGSHTDILNVPCKNIEITGNTFEDIMNCAVHGQNWENVTIAGNTIKDAPRGIVMYSHRDSGKSTYLASVIMEEGGLKSDIPEENEENDDMNIVIKNNTMELDMGKKELFSDYTRTGIVVGGTTVTSSTVYSDKSGGLPVGDYYISGVKISGNTISTHGHGIRAVMAKNVVIDNNLVNGDYDISDGTNYYGIQASERSKDITITNNTVDGSNSNGIYVLTMKKESDRTTAKKVTGNTVKNCKKYGIDIEKADVTDVTKNTISDSKETGIFVYNTAIVKNLNQNKVKNSGKRGISVTKKAIATNIKSNTVTSPGEYGILLSLKSEATTIASNKVKGATTKDVHVSSDCKAKTLR